MRRIKERALAKGLALFIEYKLKGIGKMVECSLDSTNRSVRLKLLLKGEKEPLEVKIGRFHIYEKKDESFIELFDLATSREWITFLAKEYIEGRPFALPQHIAKILHIIV